MSMSKPAIPENDAVDTMLEAAEGEETEGTEGEHTEHTEHTEDDRTAEQRTAEQRTAEQRTAEQRTAETQAEEEQDRQDRTEDGQTEGIKAEEPEKSVVKYPKYDVIALVLLALLVLFILWWLLRRLSSPEPPASAGQWDVPTVYASSSSANEDVRSVLRTEEYIQDRGGSADRYQDEIREASGGYEDAGSGDTPGGDGIYPFRDVPPGSYCYDAVRWAAGNGIAAGTVPYQFSPNQPCSAAHAVTFLWRAAGSPHPMNPETRFKDVGRDAFCYDAVCWAGERYAALGTSETSFSPNRPYTRAQFITLFYSLFGNGVPVQSCPFPDVPKDAYFRDAAAWAFYAGVTLGTTADTFSPDEWCSRGQIAVFLYRYFT